MPKKIDVVKVYYLLREKNWKQVTSPLARQVQ